MIYYGDGSSSNPYRFGNVEQLQAISQQTGANYKVISDIDASETSSWNGGNGFNSISGLTGTINGQNYEISGLTIDRDTANNIGIFRIVKSGGKIENISMTNTDITVTEGDNIGGLAGENIGSITNTYVNGTVNIGSPRISVGGLVGNNGASVSNSYWDTQSSGQSSSDGGTGLTTSEMQGSSASTNMGGFDFTSTWSTVTSPSDDYPVIDSLDQSTQINNR